MPNSDSVLGPLLAAAAVAVAIAILVTRPTGPEHAALAARPTTPIAATAPSAAVAAPAAQPLSKAEWAAAAPGRVVPKGGEIRLSAQSGGRITNVLVGSNDRVMAGDLLVMLDDPDVEARIAAADAEASVRKRDRDTEPATGAARDRRVADDAAFAAERLYSINRSEFDRLEVARRAGLATDSDVSKARDAVVKAKAAMDAARVALRRLLSDPAGPAQTRLESALSAARAELATADAASERLKIRAPGDGTVLQVNAKVGESVAPSPEDVAVVLGDVSAMQVKAEVDDRDIGKVRAGQTAVVRSDAFPGREFEGRVSSIAQAMTPSRLGQKGPRKFADADVLEVTIDLAGETPLLSGMRVDVFFKPTGDTAVR